nr:molybdopterin-dependent oxidoreductase [Candidatus Njordarchaeota archaeon]
METQSDRYKSRVGTVCPRDCYDTCFMYVHMDDNNEPIRIEGDKDSPITQGFVCPRGNADLRRANSDQRVLYPHMRRGSKPRGTFERISWTEALGILTKELTRVLSKLGPDSVLHLDYSGNQGLLTEYLPQRLFYALGSTETDYTICSASGHHALSLHYGLSYGVEPDELQDMKLTVYWGFNAAVSAPHLYALSRKSREHRGSIIAVDPRRSETAEAADLWIQPRPGSDVALAYGVMKHLIENNLVDSDFIYKYTSGFDNLRQEVSMWSGDLVKQYTGLKWNGITDLAELYAQLKPSATMIGLGMQKSLYGAESVRAISLVPALIGIHRGFYYTNSKGFDVDIPYLIGKSLAMKDTNVVSQVALGKHLKQGEFKFVYIYNMNPVETLPNQQAVSEGLSRKDVFVVVHDTHWTETAKRADLVLPAPTFLEKEDVVVSYSHRHVRKSNKVMEPLGESKSELWVMTQVADKLKLKEDWLHEDPWRAVEKALGNAFEDGTPLDLEKGKTLKLRMRPRDQYQTPTGKIEFYATKAEALGTTPLPKQGPLPLDEGFILLNNAIAKYTHTQFRDVYGPMPSTVLFNLEDAKVYGVRDGDMVELFNEFGALRLKALVSSSVPRGVLWSPRECRDLDGVPQNAIIPDTTQKLGGGSTFNTTIVKVRK